MRVSSRVSGLSDDDARAMLSGLPSLDDYEVFVTPLRYRTQPHLAALTNLDDRTITVQIPQPFFPFGDVVRYGAVRRPGPQMRFVPLTEGVTFRTPREVVRFLYLHEYMHCFLFARTGRGTSAETTCDRFALLNYAREEVTQADHDDPGVPRGFRKARREQTKLKKTGAHTVRIEVEAAVDELRPDLDAAYRRIAEQVRIPGFRKGKAPRQVIDVQVGREAVVDEFIESAVPRLYSDAIREHDLAPIGDPSISLDSVDIEKPLRFTAELEVRPRLELKAREYKGIGLERPDTEPTDDDLAQAMERLRDRFAELEAVERPATDGDYVVIDLAGTIEGQEFPEASRPDQLHEVGSGAFGPDLDRELLGKRPGDIVTFTARIAEGERAGQEVAFRVLLKDVKGKKLPPLDDDFARTASEFDTLDDLRAAMREQLREANERAATSILRDRALEAVLAKVKVDLPDSLVAQETEHRVAHARENAARAGATLEQALAAQGWDEARFRDDARTHAVRAVTSDLVLEAIARAEDLEVTPEELGQEIAGLAAAMGRDAKEVATALDRSGQIVTLAGDIIRTKALDVIVEHAEVRTGPR